MDIPWYISHWIPLVESFPTVYGFVYIQWSGEDREQKAWVQPFNQQKQDGLKMESTGTLVTLLCEFEGLTVAHDLT